MKLDAGQKHLMRLILRDAGKDGWTKTSAPVMTLMEKLPPELVVVDVDGLRVQLTDEGNNVMSAMEWLA